MFTQLSSPASVISFKLVWHRSSLLQADSCALNGAQCWTHGAQSVEARALTRSCSWLAHASWTSLSSSPLLRQRIQTNMEVRKSTKSPLIKLKGKYTKRILDYSLHAWKDMFKKLGRQLLDARISGVHLHVMRVAGEIVLFLMVELINITMFRLFYLHCRRNAYATYNYPSLPPPRLASPGFPLWVQIFWRPANINFFKCESYTIIRFRASNWKANTQAHTRVFTAGIFILV